MLNLASKSGAPRGIRTHDTRFRRPMLCPLSYRRIKDGVSGGI